MKNGQESEIVEAICLGIRDYFSKNGMKKAVLGISGGLDSAVSCFLAVKALGEENVIGVLMHDTVTSQESREDSKKVVEQLGIKHFEIPLDETTKQFKSINERTGLSENLAALANAKARTRMTILYFIAQQEGAFVLGTSDKSEIALGYTTKFGDSASDILVIGDLWKTEVFQLGRHLGVPDSILSKKPSAELVKDQNAESELGASYEVLDQILQKYVVEDLSADEIVKDGFDADLVESVVKRIKVNEHKRRSPMIIRLSERSFHNSEWRMPVTNKFS